MTYQNLRSLALAAVVFGYGAVMLCVAGFAFLAAFH
jgi:hypothetical protein